MTKPATSTRPVFRVFRIAVLLGLSVGLLPAARATTYTWAGNGSNSSWSTAPNWSGGTPPVSSIDTQVIFQGLKQLAPNNESAYTLNALTFDSTAGPFYLTGQPLTFAKDSSSNAPTLTHSPAFANITVNNALVLNDPWTVNVNAAGTLNLNGNITGSGQIIKTGGGALVFSGTFGQGGISFQGGVTRLNSTSTFAPPTQQFDCEVFDGAELDVVGGAFGTSTNRLNNLAIDTAASKVVLSNGATAFLGRFSGKGSLYVQSGSSVDTSNPNGIQTFTGNMYLDNGVYAFLGASNAASAGAIYLGAGGGTFDTTPHLTDANDALSANILHDPNGPAIDGGANMRGRIYMFGGANTYNGPTRVLANSTLFVSGVNSLQSSTVTTSATGGTFQFGPSFYSNNNQFNLGGLAGDGDLLLADKGDPANTDGVFTVGLTNQNTTFSGVLSGAGTLTKAGTGNLTLTNANTFQHTFTLGSGGLGIGNDQALSNVTVNVAGTTGAIFPVGADHTLANNFSIPAGAVLNILADPAGVHTLTLTGSFSGMGLVALAGGALQPPSEASLTNANLIFNSGTLTYITSGTLAKTYNLSNATLAAGNGSTQTITGTINGGRLGGNGSFVLGNGASVSGTRVSTGLPVTQTTGTAAINNVVLEGNATLTQSSGATLNSTGTLISAPATTITAGGTFNATGGLITGRLTIPTQGKVLNTSAPLYLNGTPAATINAGGLLATSIGSTIELNGGVLNNNGQQTGVLDVQLGGVVRGSGTFGTVNLAATGVFNAAGTITGSLFVAGGGLVDLSGSQALTVQGAVTNNGVLRFDHGASLAVTSGAANLVNNGTIDLISGSASLPAGFVNNGLVLDSSVTRVKTVTRAANGSSVTLQIDAYPGHSYKLQRSASLVSGSFADVQGVPAQGNAATNTAPVTLTFTDNAPLASKGFYRIQVDS